MGARLARVSVPGSGAPVPFERVLELHGQAVLRFCVAQAGSKRGEDVFQETMLSALRAYDRVRDPSSIRSWLFSIAARKAIDSHRIAARLPEPVADPEPLAVESDLGFAGTGIWAEVRELPDKQRQAIALRYIGDLSHREIAGILEISEAAARRNVFEGLKQLRARLDSLGARHRYTDDRPA